MKLSEKQQIFARNIALLMMYAFNRGYEITFGEATRDYETAVRNAENGTGIVNSLHLIRLALDLNLFKDGVYLSRSSDHAELGEFWKSLHPLNRWGGDFSRPDGNHYSMEHGGRQ